MMQRKRVCWLCLLCALCCVPLGVVEAASARICKVYFKRKQYQTAAQCFDGLAKAIGTAKSAEKRYQKGRWMRSAWLCLVRAARQEKVRYKQAYYYEQVLFRVRRYLAQKLYETKSQQQVATARLNRAKTAIGYAQLSVVSNHQGASLLITGFRFKSKGVGSWSRDVRPGSYTVQVTYPGRPALIKIIEHKPDQPSLLRFSPAPVRRAPVVVRRAVVARVPVVRRPAGRRLHPTKRPVPTPASPKVLPWVLVGTGAALAIGGVVMFVVGADAEQARNNSEQLIRGGSTNAQDTRDFRASADLANIGYVGGIGGVSAGVILIGVGVFSALK
jgi:hypothetical protein